MPKRKLRVVSLLPSLTELVVALGAGDGLVGVTHECDFPRWVEGLPHLTRSLIPTAATSAEIDALVAEQRGSLYALDEALLKTLRPDLILTQEQCDVCAVNEATVRRTAGNLPGSPLVESVNPTNLAEVHAMFLRVGDLLDARPEAEALVSSFQETAGTIASRLAGRPVVRTLLLEWFDPPFSSGHWNPELVALAGGLELLAVAGEPSRRLDWAEIAAADPEQILLSPCGFSLERSATELQALGRLPAWANLSAVRSGKVALIDGSAYFSRPGPRLEESLRVAAAILAPDLCGDLGPEGAWRPLGDIAVTDS